jgi:hypothetical protein
MDKLFEDKYKGTFHTLLALYNDLTLCVRSIESIRQTTALPKRLTKLYLRAKVANDLGARDIHENSIRLRSKH